jgi:hypothetical protein
MIPVHQLTGPKCFADNMQLCLAYCGNDNKSARKAEMDENAKNDFCLKLD